MNEAQRHRRLLEYLENHTYISTSDYVEMLDISLSTARRDITKLAEDGKLTKIRNGAEVIKSEQVATQSHVASHFIPSEKDIENFAAKSRIAQAAAE
ncbi:DeoR family transcriptional regulator, partial [Vibrio harveyi]